VKLYQILVELECKLLDGQRIRISVGIGLGLPLLRGQRNMYLGAIKVEIIKMKEGRRAK
jgi:hypothetical protein